MENLAPPATVMPPEKVDEAEVEVTLRRLAAIPPEKVEVAVEVFRMEPPLRVKPLVDLIPPGPNCTMFPPKVDEAVAEIMSSKVAWVACRLVEVPDTVFKIFPPLMVIPLEDERPALLNAPVSTVEVPETVERMLPPLMVSP